MRIICCILVSLSSILCFSQKSTEEKIKTFLIENSTKYKLTNNDISDWIIESTCNSETTGIDNYFIKQRYKGIEIFRAVTNVWLKQNEVIDIKNRFVSDISSKINSTIPTITAIEAVEKTFAHFKINSNIPISIIETIHSYKYKINNGDLIDDPIIAQLVFQEMKTGSLRLAWDLTFYNPEYSHLWSIRIDALNGTILEQNDLTVSCSFKKNIKIENNSNRFFTLFKQAFSTVQSPSSSYTVIPFNYTSPDHSPFVAISSPDNSTASPYGWHDTNGIAGADYTVTRGNNVWARTNYTGVTDSGIAASITNTANGYSPSGGSSLTFNFPYAGKSVSAKNSIDASCTNLFYMNNVLHDLWYQYGFNEANGNYQQNNYGKGGTGSDFVYADAQAYSTAATPQLNNSNFTAPADGQKGIMNMYLWNIPKAIQPLNVTAPTVIAGNYSARQNSFSPGHVDLPIAPLAIQSNLVVFNDGTPDVGAPDNSDACSGAINASAINGKIVLIRRSVATTSGGNPCNFTVKVKNAQTAGAKAVIIANNVDVLDGSNNPIDVPFGMSGSDATITIPAISVSKVVGDMLYGQIAAGTTVNVKLQLPSDYQPFVNSDGDFDNGVIAHEFGHGITIRLTGGPNNSSCLQNTDQAGEGWSDWFSLMLQMKPGDVGTTPLGIGTFVFNEPTTGGGIRDYPYTTDMTINPMTYAYTNNYQYTDTNGNTQTEIHGTGSVWATVLWDLAWAYVAKYGYDDNKYTGTGGNNKVMRLVLDACKLQPCSPSFIDSRNALIAADQASTGGNNYCLIWEVFAKRGFGVNASAGNTNVGNDQVEDFTQPTIGSTPATGSNCTLSVDYFDIRNQDLFRVYPNPTNGDLNIRINNYTGKVTIQVIDINGRIVNEYINEDFNIEKTLNINNLQAGVYILKVSANSLNFTQKIIKN